MGVANGTETVIVLCLQLLYDTLFYFVYWIGCLTTKIDADQQGVVRAVQLPPHHGVGSLLHSRDHVLLL